MYIQLLLNLLLIVFRPSQGCGSVFIFSGSGSESGSRVWCWRPIRIRIRIRIRIQYGIKALMTKNFKKITAEIFFFKSKTAIYLSLGLHKVCPSYRRSLQFSKEAIQDFKTWTFTNYCLLLWVIFALLDPDPDPDPQTRLNTDPIRIRVHNPGPSILLNNFFFLRTWWKVRRPWTWPLWRTCSGTTRALTRPRRMWTS